MTVSLDAQEYVVLSPKPANARQQQSIYLERSNKGGECSWY